MDFETAKAHAMGVLFDTEFFSCLVTYTPKGGTPIADVPANIVYGSSLTDNQNGDGHTWRLIAERDFRSAFNRNGTRSIITVVFRVADIANPGYGDTVEFGGDTWTIKDVFDDA